MPHRQSPRGRCFAALAATLLLATCGLPTPRPVLPPPVNGQAFLNLAEFRFRSPKIPDDFRGRLLGYEVYYKLFDETEERESGLDSRAQLESRGFFRLTRADAGNARPLIKAPEGAHQVIMRFGPSGSEPTAQVDQATEIQLRRGVRDEFGNSRRFGSCSDYGKDDRDLTAVYDQIEEDCSKISIQIQLYVMSYGMVPRSAQEPERELWSETSLFLGSITIPVR